ncbi:glycerol kinase 5 isoform X2 [Stigmatopora argus]
MDSPRNGVNKERFILSVDVGTTSIKCHVYDKKAQIRGSSCAQVLPLYPEEGHVELDPDALWTSFVSVVKGAVKDAAVQMHQMEALGISTQRATFTTWDRRTGVPFHNFISWQDRRAAALVASWNKSCTLKVCLRGRGVSAGPGDEKALGWLSNLQVIRGLMKALHFVTGQRRALAASQVVFSTQHVTFRLLWALRNYKQVARAASDGNCCFGTVDTWLLFKLTKGGIHATDYSNASATGIFDTYQMCWSQMLCSLLSLPLSIFPKVENTCHLFGSTDPSVFGVAVPILSSVSRSARPPPPLSPARYSARSPDVVDSRPAGRHVWRVLLQRGRREDHHGNGDLHGHQHGRHASRVGLYPLVGWKMGPEVVYLAEGNAADTGTAIDWARALDLFSDVEATSSMAYSVSDSNGVCFVPSFSGLQAPLNDPGACASFMGLKPSTTKCHLVRAILESVAFRNKQLYETVLAETDIPITKIRVDGGVSANDFIAQLTANLLGRKIERCRHREMSCLGAAFLAGLGTGYWRSREELKKLRQADAVFCPKGQPSDARHLERWEGALRRSMHWYERP